ASTYGKCIVADYNHVHKDKCLPEFSRLKQCYLAALKKDPRRSQSTRPGAGVT
ncbi:MAG: hypothetical protein M1833_001106, partial [Piccolia ochrophora]